MSGNDWTLKNQNFKGTLPEQVGSSGNDETELFLFTIPSEWKVHRSLCIWLIQHNLEEVK